MREFDLLTDKADIRRTRWVSSTETEASRDGLLVELERFALTSNNFTYGKLGVAYRFWDYFPAPERWGRLPVWGIARIVEAAAPGFREGERLYGFLPVATRVSMQPVKRGGRGFIDAAPHRSDLPRTYNEYTLIDRDPAYDRESEDTVLALRPLFALGFFLAEYLAENNFFGGERIVVSSASSKAAYALAHQLDGRIETFGLTSPPRVTTVARSNLFSQVADYASIADDVNLAARPTVFVDIAGDQTLAAAIQKRLGARLTRIVRVGVTHGEAADLAGDGSAANSEFFFAPDHILRLRRQWGVDLLRERLASRSADFMKASQKLFSFERLAGRAAIDRVYGDVASGHADAAVIPILSGLRDD